MTGEWSKSLYQFCFRTFVEEKKFMEGSYYSSMVEDVSKRIGIQVNTEDVELAWALCRCLNINAFEN